METQATTRLLLALWDLGGAKQEVKKGELTKRIVSKTKKVADYQGVFNELQQQGAIAISKTGFSLVSPKGLEVLGEGLKSPNFKFEGTIVGTWTANALLKWISQTNSVVSFQAALTNGVKSANPNVGKAIASYDEFKLVTLKVYEQLNRDYNLNHLVPIYRIRREIGDRISRSDFNEWLLEMQEKDILQLMAGEMRDITPDKREDSIIVPGGGLRYYAKLLNS
ncbi:hypothetical protein F7734_07045 [Scytonema sp. UIC 10036]|uniref:hypothetical protein n=1 Tax=Scytonema sp. UIC 10036 TaxID=2304196 RepID=UPI0012DA5093|nr:hypothetical protein [Scytonema sp. UIC 10036]MUG92228.1 hypothetical protein [Scytonema sp. UIC 10036]